MKTNKHCPKYRENSSIQIQSEDPEKGYNKSMNLDPVAKPQQESSVKKLIQKGGTILAVIEAPPEEEKTSLKVISTFRVSKTKLRRTTSKKYRRARTCSGDKAV